MTAPTVMLDCRWLSINGAGRLTELLLRGFRRRPPRHRWILWGPEETRTLAWPGAEVVVTDRDPRAGFGQRCWFEVPRCDLAVFLHQQRPLRRLPSVTVILDTIPLHVAGPRVVRAAKRLFLRRVASSSRQVATISRYSQACIERDLGHPAAAVALLAPPADDDFAERVGRLRTEVAPEDAALYVGAFLPHKNLDRLLLAYSRTEFRARGGRLWLVGGSPAHMQELTGRVPAADRDVVDLRGRCSQDELERLFASAAFLVQPSLEEGFGLPVLEAMSCGLPVCVSDGGALPEIVAGVADPFPATSVNAMAASIDACARAGAERPSGHGPPAGPSVEEFAAQVEVIVCANLA